ncbi:MAG: hypothetical protein HY897_02250 [Deltaproteobacteria bacterium]|nr:hypothetical protein [Deltaproteobacteria bacterium]
MRGRADAIVPPPGCHGQPRVVRASTTPAALTFLVLLAAPAIAWACGMCADHHYLISHPRWHAVSNALWLWALVTNVVEFFGDRANKDNDSQSVAKVIFMSLSGIIAVVGGISCCVYASVVGMTYAGWTVGSGLAGVAVLRLVHRIATKRRFKYQIAAHVVMGSLTAIVFLTTDVDGVRHYLQVFRTEKPVTSGTALPRFIGKGPEVVPQLVKNVEGMPWGDGRSCFYALYALEHFCTPDARQYLKKAFANPPAFKQLENRAALLFAYAGCAGRDAVDDLIERHKKTTESREGFLAVVALVRTASKKGVLYAIDHREVLNRHATSDRWKEPENYALHKMGALTDQALRTRGDTALLKSLLFFRRENPSFSPCQGLNWKFYENCPPPTDHPRVLPVMTNFDNEVRDYWEKTLTE